MRTFYKNWFLLYMWLCKIVLHIFSNPETPFPICPKIYALDPYFLKVFSVLCFGVFFGLGCSKCLPIGGWNYFIFWLVYLSLCKTMWLSYINIMIPLSLYLNTWENNLFFFFFYEVNNEHSSLSTSNKFSPSLSNSYSIGDPWTLRLHRA